MLQALILLVKSILFQDRQVGLFKVLLCWCCPPLISSLEFKTKEEIRCMVKVEEEYEDEMEEEENLAKETESSQDNDQE